MLTGFISYILGIFGNMGYAGVIILMAIESSFIPFPSEIVIPPAAYLAQQGQLNIWLVILSGILGSLIGAVVNYVLGWYLGRPVIHALARHPKARYLMINEAKVIQAEEMFVKYGAMSTFIARLLPVVRQLISIPAGVAKMNFAVFITYTAAGSAIWCAVLGFVGYAFGAKQDLILDNLHKIGYVALLLAVIGLGVWYWRRRKSLTV